MLGAIWHNRQCACRFVQNPISNSDSKTSTCSKVDITLDTLACR